MEGYSRLTMGYLCVLSDYVRKLSYFGRHSPACRSDKVSGPKAI